MKDIFIAHGVQPRLGPGTLDDAEHEVDALCEYFETQP
jgi:hypothetical protein